MSRHYTLNAEHAIAGSTTGYARITQSGAYTGVFTKAKYVKAGTGAEGIEFTFKADDGREANYLSLYTHNSSGGETYGYSQLNALMACLKLREIKAQSMRVQEYDFGVKREQAVMADAYPELMNTPIGVVLQREEYNKRDGSVGESMNLVAFFNPETRQTGGEVIRQQPAGGIEVVIEGLKDKTLSKGAATTTGSTAAPTTQSPSSTSANQAFDDEIPF